MGDRLCLFGKAFIDSPLGDINANGLIDTDQQIHYQYANGLVGEQYDNAYGLARADNKAVWNEAHFYRECSNKGTCDRNWHKLIDGTPIIAFESGTPMQDCSRRGLCDYETGTCKCFDGYSGYKCQERSVLGY